MKTVLLAAAWLVAGCLNATWITTAAAADEAAVRRELVPTGKLRVAIAVSPSASALYVVKGPDGQFRGVAVDPGSAMAKKPGVGVEFVPYLASGEITNAAARAYVSEFIEEAKASGLVRRGLDAAGLTTAWWRRRG